MNKEVGQPFVPINFENDQAVINLLKSTNNFKKIKEDVLGYKNHNLNDILLHPIYTSLWTIKSRYKYIFGSKDNGKSFQGSLKITTKWLANPKRNIVVLRKYSTYNVTSTLPDIIKALRILGKLTGIKQFEPVSAEEYRRKGRKNLFYYTQTSPIILTNSVTDQKMFFTGLDRVASGGFSLKNTDHAIDTIWAEELVDLEENSGAELMDDTTFDKWKVIESTIFRGTREQVFDENGDPVFEDDGLPKQKRREGLEWVDEEVIFTYNSHNPDYWLLREIGDKYVPLDANDYEDCLMMEKSVVRAYYDHEYQGGAGIFVMRTSAYINPGSDFAFIKRLKKESWKEYVYLYLGATKAIGGLAYQGLENYIYIQKTNLAKIVPISIGVDHANSKDHGDYFAASFLGTDFGNEEEMNGWSYPTYRTKYYFDEYGWNNKTMAFKTDIDFARELIDKLQYYVEKLEHFKRHITNNGLSIVVDSSAGSFMQTLTQEIIQRANHETHHTPWLSKLYVLPVQGKNAAAFIDGIKVKQRVARVERNKRQLINNMIVFDPKAYMTIKQFKATAYDKKKEVVDKNRDFVDAMDYAEMIPFHQERFNRTLMLKEKAKINAEI